MKSTLHFVFVILTWCSIIIILSGTFWFCSLLSSLIAPNGIMYYVAMVILLAVVGTIVPFTSLAAREQKEKIIRKYQLKLLREADRRITDLKYYSVFATPAFDRIDIDVYHNMLSKLVKHGAEVERPILPGFAAD